MVKEKLENIVKIWHFKIIPHFKFDEILIHPSDYAKLYKELEDTGLFTITPSGYTETFMGKILTRDTTFAKHGTVLFGCRQHDKICYRIVKLDEGDSS